MKRLIKTLIVLISVVAAVACSACSEKSFTFAYELEQTEYHRGDTVHLHTTVSNSTGDVYKYMGYESSFSAFPSIYIQEPEEYTIQVHYMLSADDINDHVIEKDENRRSYYWFTIPDDAPYGSYTMTLTCFRFYQTFEEAFTIVE